MTPGRYLRSTSRTSDPKTSHAQPKVTPPFRRLATRLELEEGTIRIVPRRTEDEIRRETLRLYLKKPEGTPTYHPHPKERCNHLSSIIPVIPTRHHHSPSPRHSPSPTQTTSHHHELWHLTLSDPNTPMRSEGAHLD